MCLLLWLVTLKDTDMAALASSELASAARPPRVPLITLINTASVCWWLSSPPPAATALVMLTEQQLKVRHCESGIEKKKAPLISSNCVFQSLSCNLEEVQMVKQHLFVLIPAYTRVN